MSVSLIGFLCGSVELAVRLVRTRGEASLWGTVFFVSLSMCGCVLKTCMLH